MSVEEFETVLKELTSLKAPGVSGSRIKKLTDIAVNNVALESELVPVLYSNCKQSPSSHKLGYLYVVDSIVRGYTEEARQRNETIDALALNGTFAAAVFKISELVESLIDNALELLISESLNVKIGKLVDIWERAETFSPERIARIREKHFTTTTPPGSPPRPNIQPARPDVQTAAQDSTSILLALASLTKSATPPISTPASNSAASSSGSAPVPAPTPAPDAANAILSQLSALSSSVNPSATMSSAAPPSASQYPPRGPEQFNDMGRSPHSARANMTHDLYNGNRGRDLYELGYGGRRNRSRSPGRDSGYNNNGSSQYGRRERSPPRGMAPGGYAQFNQGQYMQQQQHQPNNYTNYSQQGQFAPQQNYNSPGMGCQEMNVEGNPNYRTRNVGFDQSLPQGSIKVLSRTLFIGGVPRQMDEHALANVLRPYAEVQSVILNNERKHAFVKVYSRREAEQVISSFNKDQQLPLRTRWGVGFGPRDCCNYQHGISSIPIQRLTEADKTWVVSAQWGGTGGQPLLSGMVIDEPDIEIGAGISSKAMSKKMPTNSARNGPKSNRPGESADDYAKTTMGGSAMTHGQQPDFRTFQQLLVNPLQGLFNGPDASGGNSNGGPPPMPAGMSAPPPGMQFPPMPNGMPNMPNGMPNMAQMPNMPNMSNMPPGMPQGMPQGMPSMPPFMNGRH